MSNGEATPKDQMVLATGSCKNREDFSSELSCSSKSHVV